MSKKDFCEHIENILSVERDIIVEHIDKHKWCNGIEDEHEAIVDFVHKYAWIMREVYCGSMCPNREDCDAADQFKKAFLEDISDGEIEKYIDLKYNGSNDRKLIRLKLQIVKHDIKVHKWLNNIDNYPKAIEDFLRKFGWVIYEIYKRSKES